MTTPNPFLTTYPHATNASVYAVILAGGSGTRFWPKSRLKTPKQLCKLGGQTKTMLEITLERLDGLIPPERRIIVTHKDQADATAKIVGTSVAAIIAEPDARNTANALCLAGLEIEALAQAQNVRDPILISLHADHVVRDVDAFRDAIDRAIHVASTGSLTLIGIQPRYAETGYGYIEQGPSIARVSKAFSVASFREKPDRKTAEEYVASKRFMWNAGLFAFPVKTLIAELQRTLSVSVQTLRALQDRAPGRRFSRRVSTNQFSETSQNNQLQRDFEDAFAKSYATLPKISIDHAVLEVAKNVSVVAADIGWQDVGSWDALEQCFACDDKGNLVYGDAIILDTKRCTIDTDGPLIATIGVEDLVIVHAKNAILVCPKHRAQDVKDIVERLKQSGRADLT